VVSFQVGIDLGTTFTAAAVHRDGAATIFTLGSRSAAIPSVVLLREDGAFLTGVAAERRAMSEPERVIREFKRRLGDPTPILVAGQPFTAEQLSAKLLESVVYDINRREGGTPGQIVITHPANWGEFKRKLLDEAVSMAGLDNDIVDFITEPEAAALSYAAQERIHLGEVVAVYDLGGGTFDAAVLQRTETGFSLVGKPDGIERLGGIDFDAAVFSHVTANIDDALTQLDPADPAALAAVSRLKQDCVDAKEALSSDTDARIPVLLPNLQTEVRITRHEFEALIRPSLMDSMEAMRRAIRSASLELDDVTRVLLVGGSSRIPLISQLVAIELGLPVAVDAHPKHSIALGAAFAAGGLLGRADAAEVAAVAKEPPVDFNPNMTVVAPAHLLKAELGPRPTPMARKVPLEEQSDRVSAGEPRSASVRSDRPLEPGGPEQGDKPSVDRSGSRTSAGRDPAALDDLARPGPGSRPSASAGAGSGGQRRRQERGTSSGSPSSRNSFEDPLDFDQDSASAGSPIVPEPIVPEPVRSDQVRPEGASPPAGEVAPGGSQGRPFGDAGRPPGKARRVPPGGSPGGSPGKARPVPPGGSPGGSPGKARPVPASALSSPPPGLSVPPSKPAPSSERSSGRSAPPADQPGKAQPVPLDKRSSPPPRFGSPPVASPSSPPSSDRSPLEPPPGGVVSRAGSGPGRPHGPGPSGPEPFYPPGPSRYPQARAESGMGPVQVQPGGGGGSKMGWAVLLLVLVALVVVGIILLNQGG
jgi:actin-like ATPase involved in cell morphogenesis